MLDRTRALLQYWRNSLADVDLRSPVVKGSKTFEPKLKEVLEGRLSVAGAREIFEAAAPNRRPQGRKARGNALEEELPDQVSLLIAPFGVRRQFQHGTALDSERYHPFWIPAVLTRGGRLRGAEAGSPWIGREFLAPVNRDSPVVGRLQDLDQFLTQNPWPSGTEWASVISHAEEMSQAILGQKLQGLTLPGFSMLPPVALLWSVDKGISKHILKLYEQILEQTEVPALLRRLTTGAIPARAAEPYELADPEPAIRHCGQMSPAFPLSPSQRQTLHGLMSLPEGAVLAVNGPPGTGKTTVLQSVVASLWVAAALEEGDAPILVACSTNNQAVTNILDSFEAVAASRADDPWLERWLPGLASYGLYIPSDSKLDDPAYQKYQRAAPGRPAWKGLPETMENERYVHQAEQEYLAKARIALPDASFATVESVVRGLHARLLDAYGQLVDSIANARQVGELRKGHGCATCAEAASRIQRDMGALSAECQEQESLYGDLLKVLENISFWEDLLSFIPSIRVRRNRRLILPYLNRNLPPPAEDGADLTRTLPERVRRARDEARARLQAVAAWRDEEARLLEAGAGSLDEPGRILDFLDSRRHRLFLLAGRYWEGRWLLEMKALLAAGKNLHAQSRPDCESRFRRFSMLTPCMVATFHQAPRIFDCWNPSKGRAEPLFETIDLLIVDEAGQVSPEIGAATFALAKRALVVGDIHQIQPVWGVPSFVDGANLRDLGLAPSGEEEDEDGWAFRASRGNLMSVARCATALTSQAERGLLLTEHRRCVPEIIRFCNEVVYQGRLRPLRPSKSDSILPALGWAHIASPAIADGGSRSNPGEAQAIADWLARHRHDLQEHYKRDMNELVGVITPFVAQRGCLEQAFHDKGLNLSTGTVHTFQGAERPVIIFSPVYSFSTMPHALFFDAGPNLLNVAVSRAKDSFLMFGDMRIFDPASSQYPSGRLARFAFESPDNEITDVEAAVHLKSRPGARRIADLEGHRQILRRALTESSERVLIISPYLTQNAVKADDILAAIAEARGRGIRVCVVYSRDLCKWPDTADKVAEKLRQAGAEVRVAPRMHSKTLAVDNAWMVEGSFNWLSARRDPGHPHQNHEASFLCQGPEVPEYIQDAWREVIGAEPG